MPYKMVAEYLLGDILFREGFVTVLILIKRSIWIVCELTFHQIKIDIIKEGSLLRRLSGGGTSLCLIPLLAGLPVRSPQEISAPKIKLSSKNISNFYARGILKKDRINIVFDIDLT